MSERRYDYFVAGRWVNSAAIQAVVDKLREAGKTVYCFLDNEYDSDGIVQSKQEAVSGATESNVAHVADWQTNPTFRKIFDNDMAGLKASDAYIMVLPAGLSAHMELGVAYGLGKPCYGVGAIDRVETLYLIFNQIFPDIQALMETAL